MVKSKHPECLPIEWESADNGLHKVDDIGYLPADRPRPLMLIEVAFFPGRRMALMISRIWDTAFASTSRMWQLAQL
jgi:hypothetical protein